MDTNRNYWREQQGELRRALLSNDDHERAIDLFLRQHAMLHAGEITEDEIFSFADEVLEGLTAERKRRIPTNEEHSVAWCFWHMARIEDVTMNMLLAGKSQLLARDGWQKRLNIPDRDTGNASQYEDVVRISEAIDLAALLAYRTAVGQETRENVKALAPEDMAKKVDPGRLQRVVDEGAVVEEALGLIDYWGKKTMAELLLMPPTRHNMVHVNEAARIKKRRR